MPKPTLTYGTERFDGDTKDLFALQDEITRRIAVALNLELIGAAAARPSQHPDALDYTLQGRKCDLGFPSRMRSQHSDEQSAEQLQEVKHPKGG